MYFPIFVPILDFIHAVQYIFAAAMTPNETEDWYTHMRLMMQCWQGHVDSIIEELTAACLDQGIQLEEKVADDDPHKPLADTIRYLTNNRTRTDYPRYRRLGLPVPVRRWIR